MAGNNLSIGFGQGEASVFNPAQTVQNFANVLAQQKQQRAAEQQQLAAEFGKASPNGIRDPDRQGYMDKYSALQDLGRQKINERDPYKKALLQDQIDSEFQDLGDYTSRSKQFGANEQSFGNQLLSDQFRNQYSDNAVNQAIASRQLAMTDPNHIKDFNTLQRQVNGDQVLDRFKKNDDDVYNGTKYNTDLQGRPISPLMQRVTSGNRTGSIFTNQKVIDPSQQALRYGMEFDANKQVPLYLRQAYPQLSQQYPDNTAFKQAVIPQLVHDRPINRQEKPGDVKFDDKEPVDNFYAHYNYELQHPKDGGVVASAPQQQDLQFGNNVGTATHSPNYVPMSLSKKNFAGAPSIDMKTGKPIGSLNSSDDYSIVGAGDFPVIKQGYSMGQAKAGALVTKDMAASHPEAIEYRRKLHVRQSEPGGDVVDHLIPYESIPRNVANQKDVKKALAGFNNTPVYNHQGTANKNPLNLNF